MVPLLFATAVLDGWLALAAGAARASHALAIGISAAAAGYLVGGLHALAGWLDPFRFVSSFWWTGQAPLSDGVEYTHRLVLVGAAIAVLVTALVLIGRRDRDTAS